jgi:hypothetical protein
MFCNPKKNWTRKNPNPTHPNKKEIPLVLMMIPSHEIQEAKEKTNKTEWHEGLREAVSLYKRLAPMVGREVWRKEVLSGYI